MHTCTREFVLTRNAQAAPEAQPALRAGLILPVQFHGVSWCEVVQEALACPTSPPDHRLCFAFPRHPQQGFRAEDVSPSSDPSAALRVEGAIGIFASFPSECSRLPMDYKAVVFYHCLLHCMVTSLELFLIQREGSGVCRSHTLCSCLFQVSLRQQLSPCPFPLCISAPTAVTDIRTDRVEQKSVSLSWQEPGFLTANGTEYEVRYFEKVSSGHCHGLCLCPFLCCWCQVLCVPSPCHGVTAARQGLRHHREFLNPAGDALCIPSVLSRGVLDLVVCTGLGLRVTNL